MLRRIRVMNNSRRRPWLEMKDSIAVGFVRICAELTNFRNSRWRKYRALIV
jgi:hypothetical protein